jgi:hypothetical protein
MFVNLVKLRIFSCQEPPVGDDQHSNRAADISMVYKHGLVIKSQTYFLHRDK